MKVMDFEMSRGGKKGFFKNFSLLRCDFPYFHMASKIDTKVCNELKSGMERMSITK